MFGERSLIFSLQIINKSLEMGYTVIADGSIAKVAQDSSDLLGLVIVVCVPASTPA
jgi:hypothetical protein